MTCSAISAADNTTTATTDASDTHSSISVDSDTIQTNHDTSSTNDNSHSSDSENNALTHSDTSTSSTQSTTSNKDTSSDTSKSTSKVTNTTQSTSSIDKSTDVESSSSNVESTNTNSQSSSTDTESSSNTNSQIDNNDNCTTTTQNTTTTQSSASNVNISNSNQVENNTNSISTNLVDEKTQLKTDIEINGNEYTVHNYEELIEAVDRIKPLNDYDEYIITLDDSDSNIYYATDQIFWGVVDGSQTAQKLVIEGNDVTIEGLGVDTTSYDAENRFFLINGAYSLTLRNMKITNFYTYGFGGAIYVNGGTLIVENTEFLENVAGGHGGAIYMSDNDTSVFESTNSKFLENTALDTFGDIYGHGGAIYILKLLTM